MIIIRNETKMHRVEATINILRMFMLVSSLRIVGHHLLNPIFVSMCGVLQSSANVFKGM